MTLPPIKIIERCLKGRIHDKAGVIAQFVLAGYKQKTARARLRELEESGVITWENGELYLLRRLV